MKYKKIIRQIALKENISEKAVEQEMQSAIYAAGLDCSVQEFIKIMSLNIKKTIYSNIV